jgi:hypothetical protein
MKFENWTKFTAKSFSSKDNSWYYDKIIVLEDGTEVRPHVRQHDVERHRDEGLVEEAFSEVKVEGEFREDNVPNPTNSQRELGRGGSWKSQKRKAHRFMEEHTEAREILDFVGLTDVEIRKTYKKDFEELHDFSW